MSEPFIGQVMPIAFTFAPRGWMFCDGSQLSIQQNTSLYNVIQTAYGGSIESSIFCLPNLTGRIPIGAGTGASAPLTPRIVGEKGGEATVTLTNMQIPKHSHRAQANNSANLLAPNGLIWGGDSNGTNPYYTSDSGALHELAPMAINPTGNSQPHDNIPPVLAINYVIAAVGILPIRSTPAS